MLSITIAIYIAQVMMTQGELDYRLKDQAFFKKTEELFLDMIAGKSVSIDDREMVSAIQEISETLQKAYLYSVDKLGFDMIPIFGQQFRDMLLKFEVKPQNLP